MPLPKGYTLDAPAPKLPAGFILDSPQEATAPPATPAEAKGLIARMGESWQRNTQLHPSDGTFGTALHNVSASAAQTVGSTLRHPLDAAQSFLGSIPGAPVPQVGADGKLVGVQNQAQRPPDAIDQFQADRREGGTAFAVEKTAGNVLGQAALGGLTKGVAGKVRVSPGALRERVAGGVRRTAQNVVGAGPRETLKAATKIAAGAEETYNKTTTTNQAAMEQSLRDRGLVDQANQRANDTHASAVEKNQQANRLKQEAHRAASEEVQAHNQALVDVRQEQAAVASQIEEHAGELDRRLANAKTSAKAANDTLWNALREKTASASTSSEALHGAVQAAKANDPVSSPIFDAILKQQGSTGPLRAVVDEFGEKVHPLDPDYEDRYQEQHGIAPPSMDGINGQVGFDQLQRFNAYLNHALGGGRGKLESGQYNALKGVQDAVEASMDDIARETGSEDQLKAARLSHTQFKRAFDDAPTERNTNQRQSLRETAPEYVQAKAKAGRRAAQARYDEGLSALSDKIDALRARHKELSRVKGEAKPLPEAPDLSPDPQQPEPKPYAEPKGSKRFDKPDLDLRAVKREKLEKTAQKVGLTGYDAGVLGSTLLIAPVFDALGVGGGHVFRSAGVAYLGGKYLASRLAQNPAVIRFLTEPGPDEIRALNNLQGINKVRVAHAFQEAADHARGHGRVLRIAPAAAAFLAQGHATSGANLPQNAGEAKQRVAALR